MEEQFFEYGSIQVSERNLQIESTARTIAAIHEHPDFNLIECRLVSDGAATSEVIVVDCKCDGVPSRNRSGIQYRERLGLLFFSEQSRMPEVRALRGDFPCTAHQNHVSKDEPASLCMYFESWSEIRRTWTPQKHLSRIQWWLAETANETLHREDQPIEPIYFNSRFELVIPADFDCKANEVEHALVVEPRGVAEGEQHMLLVGRMVPVADVAKGSEVFVQCVTLVLPTIVHGRIERFPECLGDLHDQIESRGAHIHHAIREKLQALAGETGISPTKSEFVLLVMRMPISRTQAGVAEEVQVKGFIVHSSLGELGVKLGALMPIHEGKHYRDHQIGTENPTAKTAWREVGLEPLELLQPFTAELARRTSAIASAGPRGVLAGVGAVGSVIASIWQREAWGQWRYIDPDLLKPHNLARHIGFEFQVGMRKVDVVEQLGAHILPPHTPETTGIAGHVSDVNDPKVCEALDSAELVVDATTTLEAPRELAGRDSLRRIASVFVTPSGLDAVLLMEDAGRAARIDCLEPQYYRAVINESWGDNHLLASGSLRVGAGCRELSAVMSNELIFLHAATLARQIRLNFESAMPTIRVWHSESETSCLNAEIIVPELVLLESLNGQRIVWNEGVRRKVRELRVQKLPNETGGILLGYFDLANDSIYVVDVMPEPSDSQGDRTGFTRGVDGLDGAVRVASSRTAGIVGYIGEWHSHPPGSAAQPSSADDYQLAHLALELHRDGFPALMLIVGEHEEQWLVGEART